MILAVKIVICATGLEATRELGPARGSKTVTGEARRGASIRIFLVDGSPDGLRRVEKSKLERHRHRLLPF
jgi:hypothetical protein